MGSGFKQYQDGRWDCLVSGPWQGQFSADWLLPEFWGGQAQPVTRGGRGSAWFVESDSLSAVLRHFSRGGLPRHLVEKHYFFTGRQRVRSHSEFLLLTELYGQGLPVPQPVASGFLLKAGLFYQAAILMCRIPDARPLADFRAPENVGLWYEAGRCIRRFHDAGVYHADLNCMNILVADQVYLIDFDRGKLCGESGGQTRWKHNNLDRLLRSVNKCLADVGATQRAQLWQSLIGGYDSATD